MFEDHFGRGLGLNRAELGTSYRNDFLFLYTRMLEAQGWQVDLVIPSTEVLCEEVHDGSPRVRYLPVPRLWQRLLRLRRGPLRMAFSAAATVRMRPHLDEYGIIYCQEFTSGRYLALCVLSRRSQATVVGAHHGGSLTARGAVLLRVLAAWCGPLTLTTLTRSETDRVTGMLGRGASVSHVPNPLDETFLYDGARAEPRRGLLFLGRLFDDQKRLSDLLQALSGLSPDLWAPLHVVGDGPDRGALVALSEELDLASHVRFEGFVRDRLSLRRLVSNCSIHVMPSAYEGSPLAVLETQAAGVLPLVSDIPAFSDSVPEGSPRVGVGDVEGLRRALDDLLATSPDAIASARAAHRRFVASRFGMAAVGERLHDVLLSASAPSPGYRRGRT